VRKIFPLFLTIVLLFSLTSCGPDKKELVKEAAGTFMEETLSGKGLPDNARGKLIKLYYSGLEYELTDITESGEGQFEAGVVLKNTLDPASSAMPVAASGREEEFLSSFERRAKTVSLKFASDGDKSFKPVNPEVLSALILDPFEKVSLTDEDGNPLSFTDEYLDSIYAGAFWYDPLLNNPLSSDTIKAPLALRAGIYFTRPLKIGYKTVFYKDGKEIGSAEGGEDISPIKFSDLQPGDAGADLFGPGEYKAVIIFDGGLSRETGILKVI